ncbi:MAG: glycosyltransferase family 2 protein [Bacteroidota bacterium]
MMKVSVCMIAYNHQEFIAQAIESILAQKTSFPFEIVIGDDNSKDDTGRICESYASKFPDKIKYYQREKNLGMMPNFIETLYACDGKYIAICEGDDYWTDEHKLQEQADFLEAVHDYSFCCHHHFVLAKNKLAAAGKEFEKNVRTVTTEEYLLHPFFHTTSYFFRNSAMPRPFPDWYKKVLAGDHFLVLFLSVSGKMGCLNKRMSVFRNHGSSVSFTRSALEIKQNFVYHLELFNQHSGKRFQATIRKVIRKWDLLYKVYEPVGYFRKCFYFLKNTGFYLKNFRYLGGVKLFVKYLLPGPVLRRLKG